MGETSDYPRRKSKMAKGILSFMAVGAVVFVGFQVYVFADKSSAPKERDLFSDYITRVSTGNNNFTVGLYKYLKQTSNKHNMFLSPFSISTALSMTSLGAKGNTRQQMHQVLSLDKMNSHEDLHDGMHQLTSRLVTDESDGYKMNIANRLFVHSNYQIVQDFKDNTLKFYKTEAENVDFASESEKARASINDWVEDKTEKKITNLIAEGSLSKNTRLVLVNAIYFKGKWQSQFKTDDTHKRKFKVTEKQEVDVDMMFQKSNLRNGFSSSLKAQILELPFEQSDLSMVFILPDEKHGLAAVEEQLTLSELLTLTDGLVNNSISVYLPKFKLTCTYDKVGETLQNMGMRDLFASGLADLSGISAQRDLYVSSVVHKAFIEVNEEGGEAAAATAVKVLTRAVISQNIFRADHPFLFYIQDSNTGTILFIGRYADPTET